MWTHVRRMCVVGADLQLPLARILRLVNQDVRVPQRRGVGAQCLDRQPHHVLEIDLQAHARARVCTAQG